MYNLLEAYVDMILIHLNSKEPHFNGYPTELNGITYIVITNHKYNFKYVIVLDTLNVAPALVVALDIYKEFLKDMGGEIMRLIDILNLLIKCYKRKRDKDNTVCYADVETRNKIVVVDTETCIFPVKEVWQDENFIHLSIDNDFIKYMDI